MNIYVCKYSYLINFCIFITCLCEKLCVKNMMHIFFLFLLNYKKILTNDY